MDRIADCFAEPSTHGQTNAANKTIESPAAVPDQRESAALYSTVTDFARLRGLSTSVPRSTAA
jgi:hypothetical protein